LVHQAVEALERRRPWALVRLETSALGWPGAGILKCQAVRTLYGLKG
jgi:hypothetical protein